jgi:hypothetical protein
MEPVTSGVNTLRGETIPAFWAKLTAEGKTAERAEMLALLRSH